MAIPTIFKRIFESVEQRKKAKKELDEIITLDSGDKGITCTLSSSTGSYFEDGRPIRLLDEGAIFHEGAEEVRLYIEKGVIQKYYDSLEDDYVGYVNLAHFDLWQMPIVLGTWTKQDLSIVDLGDGRQAIEVTPHLNTDLYLVKDLLAQEIPLSVSVEMPVFIDYEMTEKLGYPVVNGIFIEGYSIVGSPANTSSMNVKFEGESNMRVDKLMEVLGLNKKAEEQTEELSAEETTVEQEQLQSVEETEITEEVVTEQEELSTGGEEEAVEETVVQEELSEDESAEETDVDEMILSTIKQLKEENEALKLEIEQLKSEKQARNQKADKVIGELEALMNTKGTAKIQNKKDSVWG